MTNPAGLRERPVGTRAATGRRHKDEGVMGFSIQVTGNPTNRNIDRIYFVGYVAANPCEDGGGSATHGHGISVFDLDLENLAARRTKTMVRNVQ